MNSLRVKLETILCCKFFRFKQKFNEGYTIYMKQRKKIRKLREIKEDKSRESNEK